MPYNLSYANSPYIFVESWLDELPPACDLDKEPVLPPFGYDMSGTSRRSERLRARPASGVEGPADSSEAGQAFTVANDLVYRGNPFRSAPSLTSRNGSFQSQRTGDSGPPPLSPTRSESSTATGKTTTTSRRAKSPVKSVADLYLAAKQFEFDNEGEVPDGMEKLLDIKDNMEIIPGIIEQEIQQALGTQSKVRPWMVDKDTPTSRETALRELDELRLILEESQFCENFGASEAAWNDGVTSRVLFEALRAIPSVRHHNITTARPENCLLPVDLSGEQFDSKLVDYSMNLVPSADATLEKSIRHLLGLVPRNRKFINQSTYGPIRFSPAGVHIETKASSASDGRPQLSIWIAAWLDQMRFLQCMAAEPLAEFDAAKSKPVSVKMPLVIATGSSWRLYLATDREDKVVVSSLFDIGDTRSLLGTYRLIKSLRVLAEWMQGSFRTFLDHNILGAL
ncbi:hypothetical protein NW755_014716 [Fusarium falciforme]|uniref:PD-(D/E)XK nuclease-like domain-containing protein n=1 Tax=Fusarium falciforme TaxID=195108 RepID=A0A9W8QTK0_9HYPO|nr:hypothetical protein NW755_014716 [Fusarium falciforme]